MVCLALFASFSPTTFNNASVYAENEEKTAEEKQAERTEQKNNIDKSCNDAEVSGISWILCPVLVNSTQTTDGLFDLVDDSLQIDSQQVFGTKNEEGKEVTYKAWDIFRSIANIIIVLVLLAVIFSQITGVGIDNYGIKKILPRIIAIAILLNLSYIICELAVDVSNILGTGLERLFKGIAEGIKGGTDTWSAIVSGILGVGAGAGSIAGVAVTTAVALEAPVLVVLLVLLILVAVICVGIIWVSLSIRTMIIIVFSVISPVAFALYIVPNTQTLFKKWWKVFQSGLVIYPICGALYGASFLIQAIIIGGDKINIGAALIALVAPVIPFLLIPKLIKTAMSGLGAIGASLQQIGSGVRKGISSGAKTALGSDTLKERRANAAYDRLGKKIEKGKSLSSGQRRRYLRSSAIVNKGIGEREKIYTDAFLSQPRNNVEAAFGSALRGKDSERAVAALGSLIQQGGIDEAFGTLKRADWANMDKGVQDRVVRYMASTDIDAMKAYSKYRQTGGGASFGDWASGNISAAQRQNEAQSGVKDISFAQHLKENGMHAMDSYSKDEMKLVKDNATGIRSELGAETFGSMLGSAAVNSNNAKAQTVTENIIANEIANNKIDISQLKLTADMIGSMRDETSNAILEGYKTLWQRSMPNLPEAQAASDAQRYIRSQLADQINAINSDDRIRNKVRQGTKDIFGVS